MSPTPGAGPTVSARWARDRHLPTVNALASVDGFEVLRCSGLLIGEGKPPYEYVEIIRVPDMAAFGADLGAPAVQEGAAQFQQFAVDQLCGAHVDTPRGVSRDQHLGLRSQFAPYQDLLYVTT